MNQPTPSLSAQADALKDAYAAFNRGDVEAFAKLFDPQIQWILPADWPGGGTFRGHEVVVAHLIRSRERWAEGACEPRRMIFVGDRIVQLAHVHVRLKDETDWRDGDVSEVYTFRDGKIIEVRVFGDSQQAIDWAGVA